MFVASADGAHGGVSLCAAVLHPGVNRFAPWFLQTFYRRLEAGASPGENASSSVRMDRFDVCPPLPSSALKVLKRQGVHGARWATVRTILTRARDSQTRKSRTAWSRLHSFRVRHVGSSIALYSQSFASVFLPARERSLVLMLRRLCVQTRKTRALCVLFVL